MGSRRNELRNAAGLILKLRIIVAVQDLKISFFKQILVPSHFVCPGDGTAPSPPGFGTPDKKGNFCESIRLQNVSNYPSLLVVWFRDLN